MIQTKIKGNADCKLTNFLGGTQGWIPGCCKSSHQCAIGQGDCNDDADCLGDLVCKQNSCPNPGLADCCQKGTILLKFKCIRSNKIRLIPNKQEHNNCFFIQQMAMLVIR